MCIRLVRQVVSSNIRKRCEELTVVVVVVDAVGIRRHWVAGALACDAEGEGVGEGRCSRFSSESVVRKEARDKRKAYWVARVSSSRAKTITVRARAPELRSPRLATSHRAVTRVISSLNPSKLKEFGLGLVGGSASLRVANSQPRSTRPSPTKLASLE